MALTNVIDVFNKMPEVFDADAAQGLNAVFQFEINRGRRRKLVRSS